MISYESLLHSNRAAELIDDATKPNHCEINHDYMFTELSKEKLLGNKTTGKCGMEIIDTCGRSPAAYTILYWSCLRALSG